MVSSKFILFLLVTFAGSIFHLECSAAELSKTKTAEAYVQSPCNHATSEDSSTTGLGTHFCHTCCGHIGSPQMMRLGFAFQASAISVNHNLDLASPSAADLFRPPIS